MFFHVIPVVPQHGTVQKNIFPCGKFQVKTGAQFDQRCDLAIDADGAPGRVHDPCNQLEHGTFTTAVAADQRHRFPRFNGERNILQGIKFVKKQLVFEQLDCILFKRLGFFLRQVEAHRDVLHLNDGHSERLLTDTE